MLLKGFRDRFRCRVHVSWLDSWLISWCHVADGLVGVATLGLYRTSLACSLTIASLFRTAAWINEQATPDEQEDDVAKKKLKTFEFPAAIRHAAGHQVFRIKAASAEDALEAIHNNGDALREAEIVHEEIEVQELDFRCVAIEDIDEVEEA